MRKRTITRAAIVVNANRRQLLVAHLPTLIEQSLPFDRIIVVDNGSADDSVAFCKSLCGIEVLELERNIGFAGGVNQGLMLVLADPAVEQIALINNDVRLDKNWHAEATKALESSDSYGSVATCLLKAKKPDVVDTAGIVLQEGGKPENYLAGQVAPACSTIPLEVFGACAAAALYRRDFFDKVGLFDASLFAYQEDVEIALRGNAKGWRCVFAPAARGWHLGFGSNRPFPLGGSYADFFNARNRLAVLVQSLHRKEWRAHWRAILFNEIRAAVLSIGEGRGLAVIAGLMQALLWLPGRLKRRRQQARVSKWISAMPFVRPHKAAWEGLSVGMIVKNAASLLPGALTTIPREAELLVADGGSQDGSQLLAKAAGAVSVYQDPVLMNEAAGNFDKMRNQLIELATRPWILFLDADERFTQKTLDEVAALMKTPIQVAAYDIPRINFFWGRPVRLLGEDRQIRLLRCQRAGWSGRALHQPPVVNGPVGHLCHPLLHYNVNSVWELTDRFRRYLPVEVHTRKGSQDVLHSLLVPWRLFRFYYFQQEAWRDGIRGFVVVIVYTAYHTAAEWGASLYQIRVRRKVRDNRCNQYSMTKKEKNTNWQSSKP
jgi:GT2 family glycosyltransferase